MEYNKRFIVKTTETEIENITCIDTLPHGHILTL
jgi:hypothetical protein